MTIRIKPTETDIDESNGISKSATTAVAAAAEIEIESLLRGATSTMSLMSKKNASSYNDSSSNEFVSIGNENNLTATITSIRTNVTRVLYMYFQNVTDEFGYGAATTEKPTTTAEVPLSAAAVSAIASSSPSSALSITSAATSSKNLGSTLLNSAATMLHKHLTNATTTLASAAATISSTASTTTSTAPTPVFPSSTSLHTTLSSSEAAAAAAALNANVTSPLTTASSIKYPRYDINSKENCSALFANYTHPQQGIFCNWAWDHFLCWPPTPAGVLARMHCPSGIHGIDTKKFANRKCELNGHWGFRPNVSNPEGWTDYQPCYKPEVNELLQQMQPKDIDLFLDIAKRTRTLEIVGLILSLVALVLSLLIFCNFRSLRNNRTKIHKNLFIAMVLQVIIRLTLYLDQAFRRGNQEMTTNISKAGIENTPILCEASYVLLEYARTAMFMWMFIEGLYLHNMVTVAVFQGRFPHTIFSLLGWGMPVLMTTVWAICTARYTDSVHDCWWNYNLTPYYWILEGPRLIVILLNFFFLMNIIRVLVVKLRQSQASDIEQTRKAVRAAIVLLPLLGITNLLHLVPALNLDPPWKFAIWSYVTHFLTSFQGFFIALIYCFLNGEVRTVLLNSLTVYMSVRGHPEWAPKRVSMFSGAYNTAPDTEAQLPQDGKRNESPPNKRINGRKSSMTVTHAQSNHNSMRSHLTATRLLNNANNSSHQEQSHSNSHSNNNNNNHNQRTSNDSNSNNSNWILTLCFRGQKVLRVPPASSVPPESVVFELSEQ